MKKLLKAFRGIFTINLIVRHVLKVSFKMLKRAIYRWPVNGAVKVGNGKTTFYMKSVEDEPIANNLYYFGSDAEQKIMDLFVVSLCRNIKVMLDVGANVGYYSLLAAESAKELSIYAFEPHPVNFKRLQENLAINNNITVSLKKMALGETNDNLKFYVPSDKISVVSSPVREQTEYFESQTHEIMVEQSTLDAYVKEVNILPDFIKIDVELYEREVLNGGRSLFTEHAPIILIEVHNIELKLEKLNLPGERFRTYTSDIEQLLKSYGYYFYALFKFGIYRLDSIQHHPELKNMVCAKRETLKRYYAPHQIDQLVKELIQ